MPEIIKLTTWLMIQLAALGVSALRWKLSAGWVEPAEAWAFEQMLAVQIVTSALLFPWLLRDARTGLVVFASSIVFNTFACALAIRETSECISPAIGMGMWLWALHLLANLRSRETLAIARAAIGLWTVGGAGLAYLAAEFTGTRLTPLSSPILMFSGMKSHAWSAGIALLTLLLSASILQRCVRAVSSRM